MSKMLRWLLLPLLVIATRFPLHAQEEKKEAEATKTNETATQQKETTPKEKVDEPEKEAAKKTEAGAEETKVAKEAEAAVPEDETETEPADEPKKDEQEGDATEEEVAKEAEAAVPEDETETEPADEPKKDEQEGDATEEEVAEEAEAAIPEDETETEPAAEEVTEEEVVEEEPAEPVKWDEDAGAPEAAPEGEAPALGEDEAAGAPEAETVELGEDEVMGIDTVDLADPQGNWLYKRVWWERAEAKFEKIREAVNKVLEVRSGFFAKRAELDKNVLDPFYIKIGISQGELREILKELIAKVETLLADAKSEQILEKAESDKKSLQDLQQKVEQVMAQDAEVENAIVMLVDQISKIRNLEHQAWQDFKNIARVLDDRKARELFYKVDAAWRNIKDLQLYVGQTFAGRFDKLIAQVKEDINRVDQEVSAIKESGIDLKQRLLSTQRAQMEEEQEEEPPKGMLTRFIIDPIKGIFSGIWSVITWPYYKLFGAPAPEEEDEEEELQEPEKVEEKAEAPAEQEKVPATQKVEEIIVTKEAQPEAKVAAPEEPDEEEIEVEAEAEEMPEDDFESADEEEMEELEDQA